VAHLLLRHHWIHAGPPSATPEITSDRIAPRDRIFLGVPLADLFATVDVLLVRHVEEKCDYYTKAHSRHHGHDSSCLEGVGAGVAQDCKECQRQYYTE